jgi:hypothetical protein
MAHHPPDARTLLLEAIDRGFDMRSWHGANLIGAIRGTSASMAALRFNRRRTIWEQVLHAAYWKQAVINKLTRRPGRLPRRGSNWPAMPDALTGSAWKADLGLLREVHQSLRQTILGLPVLDVKQRWLIQGAAAHDVYHAGQIKLLRRLLEERARA